MAAEMESFTRALRDAYEQSMMDYIGLKEVAASAREEGKIEGKIEGAMEEKTSTVIEMDKEGFSIIQIAKVTKLNEEVVNQILLVHRSA